MTLSNPKYMRWMSYLVGSMAGVIWLAAPLGSWAQSAPRDEFPGRRVGGGTRGDCGLNTEEFRALVPESNVVVTDRDRPALYFVVPPLDRDYAANFMLRDASGRVVHQANLTIDQSTEVLKVQAPSAVLSAGTDYQWVLIGTCNPQNRFQNVLLSGTLSIQAAAPVAMLTDAAISVQLAQSEQAWAEGRTGDAIATLTELRMAYPEYEPVEMAWQALLRQLYADEMITGTR